MLQAAVRSRQTVSIKVKICRVVFKSDDGYCVTRCATIPDKTDVTVTGTIPSVREGMILTASGTWYQHQKYGRQFRITTFEEEQPKTRKGIVQYLGSGCIRGIGPSLAERIVKMFGEQTFSVMDSQPEKLLQVNGVGKKKLKTIQESWKDQKAIRDIMVFLKQYDVSTNLALKIYQRYKHNARAVLTQNPYVLADEISGVGFKTADQIALKMGVDPNSYNRIRSGILYTLGQIATSGSAFAYREELSEETEKLLSVEPEYISMSLDNMIDDKSIIAERIEGVDPDEKTRQAIYLPLYYYCETGIAGHLKRIMSAAPDIAVQTDSLIDKIQRKNQQNGMSITYDPDQIQAILTAATSRIMVLTGGPGTGKTTITRGIITAFQISGAKIRLAAPTGRAAKRLQEATGMEAVTIHRLLESDGTGRFKRDAENPIDGNVLVVDECSMIDLCLMNSLLKALPDSITIVLVGDADQLPSVGAGSVFHDLITSGQIPVIRLTTIHRQAAASRIITNAYRINHGYMPDITDKPDSDFFFAETDDPDAASEWIVKIASTLAREMPDHGRSVQVLAPMKRGPVGTQALNALLQHALNPREDGIQYGLTKFNEGDRVMQIRNNYSRDVFNGDVGTITRVDKEDGEIEVNFQTGPDEDKLVVYPIADLDELVLAYACTVHKSQGSEYPVVIMPVMTSQYIMLKRNLLYTGFTRAKQRLIIIGEKKALYIAAKTEDTSVRNTRLAFRIQQKFCPCELPAQTA